MFLFFSRELDNWMMRSLLYPTNHAIRHPGTGFLVPRCGVTAIAKTKQKTMVPREERVPTPCVEYARTLGVKQERDEYEQFFFFSSSFFHGRTYTYWIHKTSQWSSQWGLGSAGSFLSMPTV